MRKLSSVELHLDAFPMMADLIMLGWPKNLHLNSASLDVPHPQALFFLVLDPAEIFSKIVGLKLVLPDRARELSMENVADADADPWTIATLDIEPKALSPPTARVSNATLVQQWLEGGCKRKIQFSFFCDDDEGDESGAEGDEENQEDDGEEY
ncbi:hypothetical protein BGZ46_005080 [Entomortierella lignicola]|nr:hypothetical protein BGZ46_005080 [Entomortierella lignicola]